MVPWLRLHVSNVCNFRCPQCHVFQLSDNVYPSKIMPLPVMTTALDQYTRWLFSLGERRTLVNLYGGEPLINRRNILDLIRQAGRELNGVQIHWSMNSNGSLLKEQDVRELMAYNLDFHISCDGPEAIHNQSRPGLNASKGTFSKVIEALELLRRLGAWRQITTYCSPINYLHLKELVDIAAAHEIPRIYLDIFHSPDGAFPPDLPRLYLEAYRHARAKGVKMIGPWSSIFLLGTLRSTEEPFRSPSIEVNVDGTFYSSNLPLTRGKSNPPVQELLRYVTSPEYQRTIAEGLHYYAQKCDGCELETACRGKAIRQFQYHLGQEEGYENSCAFTRGWIRNLSTDVMFRKHLTLQEKQRFPFA
ncbi:MAG: radical SAM protein [Oligoflexia bacterium]|nr:radical SAM protein [Oligoflexia bacterium]